MGGDRESANRPQICLRTDSWRELPAPQTGSEESGCLVLLPASPVVGGDIPPAA
jgi:hypothetical protein